MFPTRPVALKLEFHEAPSDCVINRSPIKLSDRDNSLLNACFPTSDLSVRDNEMQKVTGELTRLAEVEKLFSKQKYELDQLKQQQQTQNERVDENNKIEFRNLQNELQSYKANVDELNKKLEANNSNENKLLEYQQEIEALQSAQQQLQQQIEEQKVKNNVSFVCFLTNFFLLTNF